MIRSAYAGSDWLLPHGLMGRESSSVVSAGDADSSSWLSGVTAPPDIEHSVRSSCEGHTFTRQKLGGVKAAAPIYNETVNAKTQLSAEGPPTSTSVYAMARRFTVNQERWRRLQRALLEP